MALKNMIAHSIGWLMVMVVWLLSLLPLSMPTADIQNSDKLGHFLAYAVMTYWFLHLYRKKWPVVIGFILMGVVIEILQGLTTYRFFEWADMFANGLGVVVACLIFCVCKVNMKVLSAR